jgi:hypothetical protein
MKSVKTLGLLSALIAVFASAPAYASRGDMTNFAALRQDREIRSPAAKLVRIEGALSCTLEAENTGKGCELKLQENGSGRMYNLIEAKSAMRLFQDGKKNVLIEGRLAGAETIEVKSAQTL